MPAPSRALPSTPLAILRVAATTATPTSDFVATEEPLEIQLAYERRGLRVTKRLAVTMRTPGHDRELAAGFLFTEGIVHSPDDIADTTSSPETPNTIRVTLRPGLAFDPQRLDRHFHTSSSCGVCGKTSLASLRTSLPTAPAPDTPQIDVSLFHRLPTALRATQSIFDQTGGLHAAALFTSAGQLIALREDVGRHNAVDKLLGAQLLAGLPSLPDHILLVSGRASFELMQKALMAGIPILAAVGAPSSLAVDLARETRATLLGFVRDGRFNIYSGAARLTGLDLPSNSTVAPLTHPAHRPHPRRPLTPSAR